MRTINRILDFFPPFQHKAVRLGLAGSIQGILSQRLIARSDGVGRIPAVEVLTMTPRVYERIADEEKTQELNEVIEEGDFYGMQSFDQSILQLFRDDLITYDDAVANATSPSDFKIRLQAEGLMDKAS